MTGRSNHLDGRTQSALDIKVTSNLVVVCIATNEKGTETRFYRVRASKCQQPTGLCGGFRVFVTCSLLVRCWVYDYKPFIYQSVGLLGYQAHFHLTMVCDNT